MGVGVNGAESGKSFLPCQRPVRKLQPRIWEALLRTASVRQMRGYVCLYLPFSPTHSLLLFGGLIGSAGSAGAIAMATGVAHG